jgi:hypothetical protein
MSLISIFTLLSWILASIYIGQYAFAIGIFTIYCTALIAGAEVYQYSLSIKEENEQEY